MAFSQLRRKCIAYAATCCGATVGIHACSLSPNPQQREEEGKQGISTSTDKWAFPHPYGNDTDTNRFVDAKQFRLKKTVWNLKGIVDRWSSEDDDETWPWVWCVHNENGPNHVFIGVDESTLLRGKALAKNAQNNLTLVIKDIQDLEKYGYTVSDFYHQRFAVHISNPKEMDFQNKILMLEDERIVCYDRLYIS